MIALENINENECNSVVISLSKDAHSYLADDTASFLQNIEKQTQVRSSIIILSNANTFGVNCYSIENCLMTGHWLRPKGHLLFVYSLCLRTSCPISIRFNKQNA
jgi:hypothetical protein